MTELAIKNKYMNYFSKKRELEKYAQLGKMSHELFHDILNPVSSLILYFEMVQKSKDNQATTNRKKLFLLNENITKEFKELCDSGERIRNFIKLVQNNLLNPEKEEVLNIHRELKEIISLTYNKARRNSVSISFIQVGPIKIKMSKVNFYRFVINLISNGIDSFENNIDTRKRKLTIKCEEINREIVFSFIDNGCGIKKENIKKIFKENYSNKDSGFGIGLKTVKKIVLENKGSITVNSLLNSGTTFKISIPKNR